MSRPDFWVIQTFNGLSYGALLFLLASGLSLIFGVMRIVNLAHGSYFMLGGYVGLTVALRSRSFAAALLGGAVAIALIGMAMERLFLRRLKGQTLGQVLMTVGFALIFQDLALLIWGGDPYSIPVPPALTRSFTVSGMVFSSYRVFLIGLAAVVAVGLWWLLDRTRVGALVRAAVDDAEMAQGVGINVPRASLGVFALGAALAALGGVAGGGFLGVYPGTDFEVLPYAFVVVIVGGLGSLPGAIVGSVLVGLLDNFGKALFPELSYFTLFAPMAIILAVRPTGLFGRT
jgi:branched-chain amino acid transport system permease protein